MTSREQRDKEEKQNIIKMILSLRARGINNSADKVEEMHKEFITLAK
ncbi:TPA: hypothetical protein QCY50_004971 [Bacillus cereus]|nr:hypothetical protein [Bacillus cereus]